MRASGFGRVEFDWYVESRASVDGLLSVEEFKGHTWDPACGGGNIPEAFKAHDLDCFGTDLVNRGYGTTGTSFLDLDHHVNNIVSNPPYKLIEDFLRHALFHASDKVVFLARLAFLEGQARQRMFKKTPLKRVWVSSKRISMPPGGGLVKAQNGSIAYAWFVWQKGYTGEPTLGWI